MDKEFLEFKKWIFDEYPNINIEQLPDNDILNYAKKKRLECDRCLSNKGTEVICSSCLTKTSGY